VQDRGEPACAVCHKIQYTVDSGQQPLNLAPIPAGQFGNNRCFDGESWCDACRGAYNRQAALQQMPVDMLTGMVMPVSRRFRILAADEVV
jgi:hypothetical protein